MQRLTLLVFGSRMHLVELQLDKLGTCQCWCQVCMIVLGSSSFSLLSKLACKCNGFDLDKFFGKSHTGYESSGSQYPLSVSDVLGVLLCKAWTVVEPERLLDNAPHSLEAFQENADPAGGAATPGSSKKVEFIILAFTTILQTVPS